jgi:repressor LexA
MEDLAPRQREVLEYIAACLDQRGIPPSFREIADALGIRSTNGVSDHIKALERKGYLEREKGGRARARAMRLTDKATGSFHEEATVAVPIVGQVAAGLPILAEENHEGVLRVDGSLVPAGATVFALKIVGESMIEDGILDGDVVFVRQQNTARDGETVVAMVENEATVKRFYREGGRMRLQPANSQMEPIFVDNTQDLQILGRVVGVYRQLI